MLACESVVLVVQNNAIDGYPSAADLMIGNSRLDADAAGLLGGSKAMRRRQNPVLGNECAPTEASIDAQRYLPGVIPDVSVFATNDAARVLATVLGPG